jgi:chromosome partitioning protein
MEAVLREEALYGPVTMDDIAVLAQRLEDLNNAVKETVFRPDGDKRPPSFNATQLAELCGKTPDQMSRLLEKAAERKLPTGTLVNARSRNFTLAEAREWIAAVGPQARRPEGSPGAVIACGNFKGGVGKTILSMCLAQGLSLRGHRVLCIDYDPQGSLTSLFGITPTDLTPEETVIPLMLPPDSEGASDTLQHVIRSTYWDGIDLVPACHALFAGEFYLPKRQLDSTEPSFRFYEVLKHALNQGLRDYYDFVVIDTPPALSYMTMTAFWAADGLLLPLPPEGLDFTSSTQFWSMLSELAGPTVDKDGSCKSFAWVRVVPSKVDMTKLHTKQILSWMRTGYQSLLATSSIPDTAAVRVGGMQLSTVYDISKYIGSQKTLYRAREAFDLLVEEVEHLTANTVWKN